MPATTKGSLSAAIDALNDCACDLKDRVSALESSPNTDVSAVAVSLAGNDLTVSVTEDGVTQSDTVSLSQFVDDDQTITQFNVVGGNVVLTIEDGNTVSIPLSDFQDGTGTDDQTLSLIGNTLGIEDGNSVDLSQFLDNTDEQTLSTAQVTPNISGNLSISNGNAVGISRLPDGRLQFGSIAIGPREVLLEVQGENGNVLNGDAAGAGVTVARTAAGQYTVTAAGWSPFGIVATARTSDGNTTDRDNKKIQYRQLSATSYQITTTVDDNGGTADPYEDEHFTIQLREWL